MDKHLVIAARIIHHLHSQGMSRVTFNSEIISKFIRGTEISGQPSVVVYDILHWLNNEDMISYDKARNAPNFRVTGIQLTQKGLDAYKESQPDISDEQNSERGNNQFIETLARIIGTVAGSFTRAVNNM